MSSHHFVKEGQEPALLVVDAMADDHLLSTLEWSPLVLATSLSAEKIASWGVRIDAVFAEGSAHNESVVLEAMIHAGPATVVDVKKGLPDAVFKYLRNKNQFALQIVIAAPEQHLERWQHVDFQIALMDVRLKWSWIPSGRFEKWMPAESNLLIRAGGEWTVAGAVAGEDQLSVVDSGLVRVSSQHSFWIGESIL